MSEDVFQVRKVTDYRKCFFCQDASKTNLRYPFKRKQDHGIYETLKKEITELFGNGVVLPWGLNLTCIDDGSGIAKTLLASNAIHHAKCRLRIRELLKPFREKTEEENKKDDNDEVDQCSPAKTRRTCDTSYDRKIKSCFKCGPNSPPEKSNEILISASTKNITKSLLRYATISENWKVLGKLSTALDATAADIHYHSSCKTDLWNDYERKIKQAAAAETLASTPPELQLSHKYELYDSLTFAQLIAYVKYSSIPLRIYDLIHMFVARLQAIGIDLKYDDVHTTKFKDRLLDHLGDNFSVHLDGKFNVISSNKVTAEVLGKAATNDQSKSNKSVSSTFANTLVDTMLKLREFIFEDDQDEWFKGTFKSGCMKLACSKVRPLLAAVEILLRGPSAIEFKGEVQLILNYILRCFKSNI